MLRGENIVCGTSSTGTGTLTMAAPPAAVGAIDPHIWLTSKGYASGGVHVIPYKWIEFTDNTYATPKQMEQGIATYTLGASLTADTLARTTVLSTQVVSTPAYADTAPSALSIGVAANTLIFLGVGALDFTQACPYVDQGLSLAGFPPEVSNGSAWTGSGGFAASGSELYCPFKWARPMLVKRATIKVQNSTTGTNTAFFRLYEVGSNGRPGRLIIDLGALGGANPLNATGLISTALASPGVFLTPGVYFASLFATYTGSPVPAFMAGPDAYGVCLEGDGQTAGQWAFCTSASGASSPAPDPANLTSYGQIFAGISAPVFGLNSQ